MTKLTHITSIKVNDFGSKKQHSYVEALLEIKNLRLRTIIGFNDWERKTQQDVVINIKAGFPPGNSTKSDCVEDTLNYKTLSKRVIKAVEESKFNLLEKLTQMILDIVMENPRIVWAKVKVYKPFALRFSDSVSIELSAKR
ncbi:FolB domain-containing protein [Moorena bouillonii]|uniref:FolB domain-containing protein n=1 Tax=Moorena bouillonii TaxID=207920 RepID=UPI0018E9EFBD|nr:FolB domain-containing protein [Moorena bouillonii]